EAQSFDSFYAKFKTAVANQDQAALQGMMSTHFDFWTSKKVGPGDVFQALADNNNQQWTNLQTGVQQGGTPVNQPYMNRPARLLQCTPTQVIYNCYIVFQKDSANHWRWKGMVMPQK